MSVFLWAQAIARREREHKFKRLDAKLIARVKRDLATMSAAEIARKHKLDRGTVGRIRRGETYRAKD